MLSLGIVSAIELGRVIDAWDPLALLNSAPRDAHR
jgi:hypothetical protein